MSYRPPYYKMYPQDFLSSPTTRVMTLAEKGLYKHLLDHAWLEEQTATLPGELTILAKLVGVDKRTLRKFTVKYPQVFREFAEDSQRVYNARQMAEYQEFLQTVEKNRLAGVASGKARQSKGTRVQHPLNHSDRYTDKEEEKKTPAAKLAPPPDPRHKPVFDFCYEAYELKYGSKPTWGAQEGKALKVFLRQHTGIAAEEILRRFRNFLASSDRYHADKHGSLRHLLSNFDTFADGPMLAALVKGKGNAKLDPNEAVATTMRGAAVNAGLTN